MKSLWKLILTWGLLSILLSSCKLNGSDEDEKPEANINLNVPDSTSELRGSCEQTKLFGSFEVAMEEERGYSAVSGDVSDAVLPASISNLVGEEGGCKLMLKKNPFCDPGCASDEACNHEGQCVRFPVERNLGTVTILGLKNPVSMEPAQPGNNYFFTGLEYPGFVPETYITLRSTGGEFDPITLNGRGVESIDVITEEIELKDGEDVNITWAPPTVETGARVYFRINIDQHGNSPVAMTCDVEDTGSASISAALITQLINYGVSGYPSIDIYRRTVDKVEVSPPGLEPGCVEFRVFSHIGYTVSVANHTPCTRQSDCKEGEQCDLPTQTCVPII